jgi:hypothetical protein
MKKLLLVVLAVASLGIYGCSGDSTTFPGNPSTNPNTLQPTGTIQGVLTDSVTHEPIVGAVIDIAGATASTNGNGQYEIRNVPATSDSVSGVQTIKGTYQATINLQRVTSPVNMVTPAAGSFLYPQFAYTQFDVTFTSLNDSNPGNGTSPGSTSASNHATPVTGIAQGYDLTVGKLSAGIAGQVATTKAVGETGTAFVAVQTGYTVNLISASNKIVATATTDATGSFSFSNVQANQTYTITATNADQSSSNLPAGKVVVTGGDSSLLKLLVTNGNPVVVSNKDTFQPVIASVSPLNLSTVGPTGALDVVYTFSKPIKQTGYSQALTAATPNGLYYDISVIYAAKSNVSYSLAWSTDFTKLTVTIPALAVSAKYVVDISAACAKLTDSAGNSVFDNGKAVATYYTNGGQLSTQKPVVAATNANTIDFNSSVVLDWNPVAYAKKYNVYRSSAQVWAFANTSTARNVHQMERIATNQTTVGYVDVNPGFVEYNTIKKTWSYVIVPVNVDGLEGTASNLVTVSDVVAPKLLVGPTTYTTQLNNNDGTLTLYFGEPLDKAAAETASNYTLSNVGSVTVTKAVYLGYTEVTGAVVKLTLSAKINVADITNRAFIDTGVDGLLQSVAGPNDVATITLGNGVAASLCIGPGPNGVINSVPAADDALATNSITSGPNGICQTTAAGDDVQVLALNKGKASAPAIAAGPSLVLQATLLGDDVLHDNFVALKISNVKDVAGNVIDPKANGFSTAGTVGAF